MEILSLDKEVDKLISDIRNSKDINNNDMLKTKVAFQLSKVNLGLKLIDRLMTLYVTQEKLEDKLFKQDNIDSLSIKDTIYYSQLVGRKIDNYYNKINQILSSIKIKELEASLLLIKEADKTSPDGPGLIDENSKKTSMELLKTISDLQNKAKISATPFNKDIDAIRIEELEDDDDDDEELIGETINQDDDEEEEEQLDT